MAEVEKTINDANGYDKSSTNVKNSSLKLNNNLKNDSSATGNEMAQIVLNNHNNSQQKQNSTNISCNNNKPKMKKYYMDELGFYRHLDPDQKQYVCSNLSSSKYSSYNEMSNNNNNNESIGRSKNGSYNNNNNLPLSRGDGGYEVCFTAIRHDLGISHFDKTDNYEVWKKSWDDFMRSKLTKEEPEPITLTRALINRVRSGIPHDYRCKVWSAIIKMRTKKIRDEFGDNIYDELIQNYVTKVEIPDYLSDSNNNNNTSDNYKKKNANLRNKRSSYINNSLIQKENGKQNSSKSSPSSTTTTTTKSTYSAYIQEQCIEKCFKQIELDLLRTLPNNRHFENPNSIGIQRVRRVLRAYACFNPTVGYCQGMNRLAAMALLVLPEEEAFWCLVAIIQCIMPKDYYLKPWLAQVDCYVLKDLIEKKIPKLHKHLIKNDIDLTLFTWFFTIFVDGFRPELMLRIWDCFLLEGDKVLFRFALSILYIYQADLLEMNDFSTISSHLARLVSTRSLDMEHLFETFNKMDPLSNAKLKDWREDHRIKMQMILEERD